MYDVVKMNNIYSDERLDDKDNDLLFGGEN